MDTIIKITGIGFVGLIFIIIIKQYKPEFALYISMLAGIIILFLVMDKFREIIELLRTISNKSGVNSQFLGLLLKMTGIAFLAEFAINICKDAGEGALASKVEIGSKIIVVSMSIPIISSLLQVILKLI